MRILLTGANGFIGAQLTAVLLASGHQVVGAVRQPASFQQRFPQADAVAIDLNRDLKLEDWLPRLAGIDAVINCAGILQGELGQSAEAIHYLAPKALFDACARLGISRVIQISAISADAEASTAYAMTKLQADDHLRSLHLDWIVLRPLAGLCGGFVWRHLAAAGAGGDAGVRPAGRRRTAGISAPACRGSGADGATMPDFAGEADARASWAGNAIDAGDRNQIKGVARLSAGANPTPT